MSLKKKKQRKSELIPDIVQEPEEEIRGFPRLHQRRNIKKISENEMKSLEEKGRKILGI